RRRHTKSKRDWSSDVCSSDLDRLHLVAEVSCCCFCVFCRQVATADEVFGVRLTNTAVVLDLVVEDWLGHRWVIGFVVTAQAVANQLDEDVLAESTTVFGSQLAYPDNCFWVVAVDVEDRAIKALGKVGGVVGRT